MIRFLAPLLVFAAALARPVQEEGKNPPDVKIDVHQALAIVEKEYKGEEKTFVTKIELRKPTEEEKKANKDVSWVWQVDVQTFHAGHWGPAGMAIDALTGKVLLGSTHDHK